MRTRRQAQTEQQDEPEEREEGIVYEVRENVDDLFEGYCEGTKMIVVAFEVTRKAFFRKDERNNDGALKKRGSTPENLFRNFTKGKTGFMAKTFYKLNDAKAFATNPNEEKERRKNARAETAEQKTRRTEQRATRVQREPDCRRGRPAETFYRERHEETIYAHFPNPGEEATEEQKKWQSDFFKQIPCDARKEVPTKNLYGKEKNFDYRTFASKVNEFNLTRKAKAEWHLAHHVFRQVYNATIFFINQRGEERYQAKENERVPPPSYEKKELRHLVYGLKNRVTPTPGMKNCAKHIPSNSSLAVTARRVQATWKKVPYVIKEDAVNQAWMAWKTNMQKVMKRKDENPNAKIKPFNLRYRKFSQTSVINLKRGQVVVRFVKAEKKVRVVEADEQIEQSEQTSRSDERKKKQKEKKKRDRERRKQKRESARALNPPPQPLPRDENSPNQRVHFFAEFSRVKWCRDMKVVEESAPVEYGIRLCNSEKVAAQILENDCENVVQTRLRYNPKTKEHFIDAIIKVPKTSEDKEGEVIVGGTDAGNTPFCTFYCGSTGEYFDESVLGRNGGRDLLFTKKEKRIEELEKQLEKMSWTEHNEIQTEQNRANPRTRKQWCQARRMLKKRLEKARVSLRSYRKKFHYMLAKKGYEKNDVLVHNKLDSKRTYVESKETYDGFGRKARKNASILAQAEFAEVLKHVARRTPGKKYITGGGEKGTTKTCCYCYKWNPKLDVSDKEYRCKNEGCKKVYPRDPGAAKNNTVEGAQYKKELAEAERAAAEEAERAAAEEAERAAAEAAERERAVSARAERARKRAEAAERERRSLRQRVR